MSRYVSACGCHASHSYLLWLLAILYPVVAIELTWLACSCHGSDIYWHEGHAVAMEVTEFLDVKHVCALVMHQVQDICYLTPSN